ncbi:beta-N-acetylglucosaminidase domain-containing protein [Streptomyces sp. NPDC052682]|uniref:beta-N-acetylglucosaminidase domain-containing protein n=1 Tax=Streptomyces sp. NPDC052682 TaxID=3154954 RepID=UPI00341A489C
MPLRRGKRAAALAFAVVAATLGSGPGAVAVPPVPGLSATPAPRTAEADPSVWPRPRSLRANGAPVQVTGEVALIADAAADPYALDALRELLRQAGARRFTSARRPGALAVRVETGTSRGAALPAGGYRLTAGRGTVSLTGADEEGLFHAVQTLRQLLRPGGTIRAVDVRDWPGTPVRGITEGFYGTPWTHRQRLAQLDFLGRTKQNRYLYAPGDDLYRQARWKEPYPAGRRAQFRELAERARRNHVTLGWAVAPGQAMCLASDADLRALTRKLDAMWALGFRAFQLQFQDVSYSEWHCAADAGRFGSGPGAAARAQARVANAVARHLAERHPGSAALSLMPTEYYEDGTTAYRRALAAALDQGVEVAWTGVGVVPRTITGRELAGARAVFRHPLVTLDNYPVNDYAPGRLFLGPYQGREPAVAAGSAGLLANAMAQPEASRIPLFTAADYAWNPRGYRPRESWHAAITDLAAGDARRAQALAALAGNDASSVLGAEESAYLRPLIAAFWRDRDRADGTEGRGAGPGDLGAGGRSAGDLGAGGRSAGDLGAGGRDASGQDTDHRWSGGRGGDDRDVGGQAADGGGADARDVGGQGADGRGPNDRGADDRRSNDQAADNRNADGRRADNRPPNNRGANNRNPNNRGAGGPAADGRHAGGAYRPGAGESDAAWRLRGAFAVLRELPGRLAGTALGAEVSPWSEQLARYGEAGTTALDMLRAQSAGDAAAAWTAYRTLGRLRARLETARVTVGEGVLDPFLRRAQRAYEAWAGIDHEPPTAPGDQPGTRTLRLPRVRPLAAVTVLADPGAGGTVEVHAPGAGWRRAGDLTGTGATELRVGRRVDAVRVTGSSRVRHLVPWFADSPAAALDLPHDRTDVEIGGTERLTLRAGSLRPADARGRLTVEAPEGVRVRVPRTPLAIARGATVDVPVEVTVPEGTRPMRSYAIRLGFGGTTRALTVRAVPRTGGPDLARAGRASSSADETPGFPASAANDGDPDTRWSSPVDDGAWWQVELPRPVRLGKVVLHWQDAYPSAYRVQVSADGRRWRTAAAVREGRGGRETVRLDEQDVRYVRVRGVRRATPYGYSLWSVEAYAVTL